MFPAEVPVEVAEVPVFPAEVTVVEVVSVVAVVAEEAMEGERQGGVCSLLMRRRRRRSSCASVCLLLLLNNDSEGCVHLREISSRGSVKIAFELNEISHFSVVRMSIYWQSSREC